MALLFRLRARCEARGNRTGFWREGLCGHVTSVSFCRSRALGKPLESHHFTLIDAKTLLYRANALLDTAKPRGKSS
eukprot:733761-Rhodomonas_salina.2